MHKISIITPSFNREKYVAETLDSVQQQTYKNWEHIIVDDGSSDSTKTIIQSYADKDERIKLYDRSRNPKGACTCRNEGADLCTGEYLIFLDTDDLLEPFCLEQRIQAIQQNTELDFAIFPSLMFRKKAFDLGLWWNIDKPIDELTRQFHQDAICQGTGVIWKKEAFNRIGQWSETLHLWQDIDLFFRAYIQDYRYKKFFSLKPDLHNRILDDSLSHGDFFHPKKTQSRIETIQSAVTLLIKHKKYPLLKEARYMLAEIIIGLAKGRHSTSAYQLITWGIKHQVFTKSEKKQLQWLVLAHKTRMVKIPLIRHFCQSIEQTRAIQNTLGKLPYPETTAFQGAEKK